MTNTPKPSYRNQIKQVYEAKNCASRLVGAETEVLDGRKYKPEETAHSGFVEWRFERRVSLDKSCVLLADVFIDEKGNESISIVVLEVDGQEYYAVYDAPQQPDGCENEL